MAEEQQDVETLKRRGRRRLVGAVALVLLAVIVLPMVFDPDPRGSAPVVPVKIPAVDEAPPFAPKLPAKAAPQAKESPPAKAAPPATGSNSAAPSPPRSPATPPATNPHRTVDRSTAGLAQ